VVSRTRPALLRPAGTSRPGGRRPADLDLPRFGT